MIVETNNLIRVRRYADTKGVSQVTVYNWMKNNIIQMVIIDGMKFVNVEGGANEE